tara:strand:- start:2660 stop:2887 length:228 start_codon:yes stop_codon:yes gene_type:complete
LSGLHGLGSAINDGELLFLAISTCFCNDLYREAKKRGIEIDSVQVETTGEFSEEGVPAKISHTRQKLKEMLQKKS